MVLIGAAGILHCDPFHIKGKCPGERGVGSRGPARMRKDVQYSNRVRGPSDVLGCTGAHLGLVLGIRRHAAIMLDQIEAGHPNLQTSSGWNAYEF